jgi:hypothetical protein
MDRNYWHRQTPDKPLFSELEWSQPQQRNQAGKLLIVGGNAHGFSSCGEAYTSAQKAGAGAIRIILPDGLKKTLSQIFPESEFAPSSHSGGLHGGALDTIISASAWADTVLLAGDFGNNSETAVLLEQFVQKYKGPLVASGDTIDHFNHAPQLLSRRAQTLVVLGFAQLQKYLQAEHFPRPLVSSTDLLHTVELLHDYSQTEDSPGLLTEKEELILVALGGQVCSTKLETRAGLSLPSRAAFAAVWWMQNLAKPFESISVSARKN